MHSVLLVAAVLLVSGCRKPKVEDSRPSSPIALKFDLLYQKFLKDIPDPFPKFIGDTFCDVSRLPLVGFENDVEFNMGRLFATGTYTSAFKSKDAPFLIAKIANLVAPPVLNYLAKERAALKILSDLADITQPLLDIKPGNIASICSSAILVTEFVGEHTLKDAQNRLVPDAMATAARAIGILQKVHEKGLIHGDIHFKNWVFSDLENIPQTLRLIDFGRAELFISKDGRHVPEAKREYQPWYDLTVLSPFELDGWVKTRRDDMFRLAEMFVGFFSDPPPESEESQPLELSHGPIMLTQLERKLQLAKAKRERVFTRMTPPIFIDFYTYCVNLDFSARPDYEKWIEKFSSDN